MSAKSVTGSKSNKSLKKFLKFFKGGFNDPKYYAWERGYKEEAHRMWEKTLNVSAYKELLAAGNYKEIARRAVNIESRTNLLFSFEKMALRDAVKSAKGAKLFSEGLYNYIYGKDPLKERFENFVEVLSKLPRIQTRVVTWPVATVFGFIANPKEHIFLKPRVTMAAAEVYGHPFNYSSKVLWETYDSLLKFAKQIKKDLKDLRPKDMIDLQSFIWVLGSDEYA